MIEDISLYRTFVEVAKCGSITNAAKNLFVTQPAISVEINTLETELKVKLFVRTNRGMKLTPEGEILYKYVTSAFAYLRSGEEILRDMTGLRSGILRIGASDMTLKFYLLNYIGKFAKKYPDVKLNISNNPTPQTLQALRNSEIDFGVISDGGDLFDNPVYEDFEFIKVKEIRDIFVCSVQNPLSKEKDISVSELSKHPIIMLEKHTSTRRYLSNQNGFNDLEADMELSTSDLIIEFAKRDMGIASIVDIFANESIQKGELVELDMAITPKPRHFLVAYLKKLPLSAAAKQILTSMLGESWTATIEENR